MPDHMTPDPALIEAGARALAGFFSKGYGWDGESVTERVLSAPEIAESLATPDELDALMENDKLTAERDALREEVARLRSAIEEQMPDPLWQCPYLARYENREGHDPEATCSFGCIDEPSCVTDGPWSPGEITAYEALESIVAVVVAGSEPCKTCGGDRWLPEDTYFPGSPAGECPDCEP